MSLVKKILIPALAFMPLFLPAQQEFPRPTSAQLAWHEAAFYLFMHFGPNTFTGLEWGHGNEKQEIFNPTSLDCEQWCRIAKTAGAKAIIITAKHHDGFCLWPSKFSNHTVRESKWKEGKGDVLKELSAACKKYGLKFGVYISPWDRNHPDYGTEKYNDVFVNMMQELFTNYGPIWELWWDGANGEGPNGRRQVYDWKRFEKTVRELSPNTVVFSDIGPDVRWVGNESGFAGKTNWNTLDTAGFTRGAGSPSPDTLQMGNVNGKHWIPAECDVSIRPGWFYHQEEDGKVKTPEQLFDLYLKSVGRGANLLLNVPPDRRGLITGYDSAALAGFTKLRQQFSNNLATKAAGYFIPHNGRRNTAKLNDADPVTSELITHTHMQSMGIEFSRDGLLINCIVLREALNEGQHCEGFRLIVSDDQNRIVEDIRGSTIGNKRILTFPAVKARRISLLIEKQKASTRVAEIEAYLIDDKLVEQ